MSHLKTIVAASALIIATTQAHSSTCTPDKGVDYCDPPAGNVIFDLDGIPLPKSYTPYTVSFVAAKNSTTVSFQFRNDPAFWYFDDVVLQDNASGPNLLQNGDFEGSYDPATYLPDGWTYVDPYGTLGGSVDSSHPHRGAQDYVDGAAGAYDGISQEIATTIGDTYTLSFWLYDNSGQTVGSRNTIDGSVGGGDGDEDEGGIQGVDMLVYADAQTPAAPTSVPEPGSIALLGLGLVGLAAVRRSRLR